MTYFVWDWKNFLAYTRLWITKKQLLSILRLRLQLVRLKNDRKTKVSYNGDFFRKSKNEGKAWELEKQKNVIWSFCTSSSSGDQVDGLPLALYYVACFASCSGVSQVDGLPPVQNKHAGSASYLFFGRVCEYNFYPKQYTVKANIIMK